MKPSAEHVAVLFAFGMRTYLTQKEIASLVKANKTSEFCNANDYCDANQLMLDAVHDAAPNFYLTCDEGLTEDFMDLANEAWAIAKKNNYWVGL